ncbi:MAG: DUF4878 domain-containing protein [Firmicutes bacterium]|nr:DUF4878 domain-containing protein [Bacillota bacterium]
MKKQSIFIAAIMLILVLTSCGSKNPSPTEITNNFLSAVKSQDSNISSFYTGDTENDSLLFDLSDVDDSLDAEIYKLLEEKLLSFEYETSNETIEENKATVDVTITAYNLGEAYSTAISEYIAEAFSMAFSGASDEEISMIMNDALIENIENASFDYTKIVTVHLINDENSGWLIDDSATNSELLNALSGGLAETVLGIASGFNEL